MTTLKGKRPFSTKRKDGLFIEYFDVGSASRGVARVKYGEKSVDVRFAGNPHDHRLRDRVSGQLIAIFNMGKKAQEESNASH